MVFSAPRDGKESREAAEASSKSRRVIASHFTLDLELKMSAEREAALAFLRGGF